MSCTIVSLLPKAIEEKKPIYPNRFFIPAAKRNDFEILVLADEYIRRVYIDDTRGTMNVPEEVKKVANAVCFDYISSTIGVDADCRPGLFYLEGKLTKKDILERHSKELEENARIQRKWFERLVRLADDDWKIHGQHKMITELQRLACDQLGLKRDWNVNPVDEILINCPMCTTLISNKAIVCPQCNHIVDETKYNLMKAKKSA